MKFLKKPVFIKKIRSYSDNVRLNSLNLENNYKFTSNKNILKSSYLEKVIDSNSSVSNLDLKGGFFYLVGVSSSNSHFININNKILFDSFNFKNHSNKIDMLANFFKIVSLKKTSLFLKFKI